MKLRHFTAWFSGLALLATGATLLCAQPPQAPRERPVRVERDKLRAQVIKLRTDVEMLRIDYELARDGLFDAVKTRRSLKMAGGLIAFGSAIQTAINDAGTTPPGAVPPQESEQDRKRAAADVKAAELEEKKDAAEEAAFIAERKKELAGRFALLAEKRLDLEDAERSYREISR